MRLAFYQGTSLTSRLIRWQTRSVYSHVGILFPDDTIIEAWQNGGVLHNSDISRAHSPGTKVDIFRVKNFPVHQEKVVHSFLKAQLGKGYDFLGVARFITRRDVRDPARWFCSELTHAAYLYAGWELLRTESYRISPGVLSWSPHLVFETSRITEHA